MVSSGEVYTRDIMQPNARISMQHPAKAILEPFQSREPRMRLTYAITPPNLSTNEERRAVLANATSARISSLPLDALLVYDLQDESARTHEERPFPFSPKVDALSYAFHDLEVEVPRVVYRAVANHHAADLRQWLARLHTLRGRAVFVGAPSRRGAAALTLDQAYYISRTHAPELSFGAVLIAERHQTSGEEDLRAWRKMQQGCRFFVSQTMWSAAATKALLRAVSVRRDLTNTAQPQLLLTLSPCGSEQTLRFQRWLGVDVPPRIANELLHAPDMLARSIELAAEVFEDVHAFAQRLGIDVGCNVESVSSRLSEIEASIELTRRIAAYLGRSPAERDCRRERRPLELPDGKTASTSRGTRRLRDTP